MTSEVVAFDFSGDALLAGDPLTLDAGLTVLYGANGAGKSRLLSGMRAALTGIKSDVEVSLVVRVRIPDGAHDPDAHRYSSLPQPGAIRPLVVAVAQELFRSEVYAGWRTGSPDSASLSWAEGIITDTISRMAGEDLGFRQEVLDSRLFLLTPTGTDAAPSWDAWPVADLSRQNAARIAALLDAADALWEAADDADPDAEDQHFEEWQTEVDKYALFSRAEDGIRARGRRRTARSTRFGVYSAQHRVPPAGIELVGPIDFGVDVLDTDRDPETATNEYFAMLSSRHVREMLWALNAGDDEFDQVTLVETMRGSGGGYFEVLRQEVWGSGGEADLAGAVEAAAQEVAEELAALVNEYLTDVLLDPPRASLAVAPQALRFTMPQLAWRFERSVSPPKWWTEQLSGPEDEFLSLADLSRAEVLWTQRTVIEAIYWHQRNLESRVESRLRPVIYLLDEPESALHRTAEAHMAQSLHRRAADPRVQVVAATHSPELLDAPDAHVVEVKRAGEDGWKSRVQRLDLSQRTELEDLGLTPSDLLRWPRVILLVEGDHDEIILDEVIGARLRQARVQILPMRGTQRLPLTVDSQVLFNFTRAHLVALVDNQEAELLERTWAKAREAAVTGEVECAIATVLENLRAIGTEESRAISEWLIGAVRKGRASRVSPYGLAKADIVEYLPVEFFVPTAHTWEELRAQHHDARNRAPKQTPRDFKKWLTLEFGSAFTPETLRAGSAAIAVPRDFGRLISTLEALSHDAAES